MIILMFTTLFSIAAEDTGMSPDVAKSTSIEVSVDVEQSFATDLYSTCYECRSVILNDTNLNNDSDRTRGITNFILKSLPVNKNHIRYPLLF